jgi:ribonuclease E
LRLIEEEAMKKGTERVIAHLPIDCATFLLNEKRAAIQELEARLKVSIVVLPSKHLDTPAYDIERIKSVEAGDDKTSHQFLKLEENTVPEFVKHSTAKVEKAAVKEFLPDAPAPVQNKKTSSSLIQRFWQKLVGSNSNTKANDVAETAEKIGEDKPKHPRHNNNRRDRQDRPAGRNNNQRRNNNNKRQANPQQNPNNAPVAEEVASASAVVEPVQTVVENVEVTAENAAKNANPNQERGPRRGRNRRRNNNRNNSERRQEGGAENPGEQGEDRRPAAQVPDSDNQPRSYANEFAERSNRQEVRENTPAPAPAPAPVAEPRQPREEPSQPKPQASVEE